jgi:hypothetical protein
MNDYSFPFREAVPREGAWGLGRAMIGGGSIFRDQTKVRPDLPKYRTGPTEGSSFGAKKLSHPQSRL